MAVLDGIELSTFSSSFDVARLYESQCAEVPTGTGVYVVRRPVARDPRFLTKSGAGWFKDLDPSYPPDVVRANWVPGALILYVGKAAGREGLRQRIGQLVAFGFGKAVGHRGGRMLWHLSDCRRLQVAWKQCSDDQATALKTALIDEFRDAYGVRPFANMVK